MKFSYNNVKSIHGFHLLNLCCQPFISIFAVVGVYHQANLHFQRGNFPFLVSIADGILWQVTATLCALFLSKKINKIKRVKYYIKKYCPTGHQHIQLGQTVWFGFSFLDQTDNHAAKESGCGEIITKMLWFIFYSFFNQCWDFHEQCSNIKIQPPTYNLCLT